MDVYPPVQHIDATHFFKQKGASQDRLFQHRILTKPMFDYVVKYVKFPLARAMSSKRTLFGIISILWTAYLFSKKIHKHIGKVTKENTIFVSTHNLIDERDEFFRHHHNPHNNILFDTAYDIALAVTGHDPYYEWLYRWHCWEVVKQYKEGRLPSLSDPPKDIIKCWRE